MKPCAVALTLSAVLCGSAAARGQSGSIDVDAVAALVDAFFPPEMERRQIPGAVFVFVANGTVALARGFGAAQLQPRRAVDPERTVFRLASVSKTITATAALQLVEQGRLSLHRNVNEHLRSVQIPARHGPITLHHLLTHTAGFDERLIGLAARSPAEVSSLPEYVGRWLPPSFAAPGQVISYSNHGFALVGLLIQDTVGRPFGDYVQQEIFARLGMTRSGVLTGAPPENLAVAYDIVNGQHRPLSPEYLQGQGAGALFTTGTDMGRFLVAHLRHGAYRDRRILQPETMALMHARQFSQMPGLSGWAYGLWEDTRDGRRALLHNGGGKGYRSLLYLLPDLDAGFFIAYNLADRHPDGELQELFIDRFRRTFVRGAAAPLPRIAELPPMKPFTGEYRYVRRARTTVERMIALFNVVQIQERGPGTLRIVASSDDAADLEAIGPAAFRRADERGLVAFDTLHDGAFQRALVLTGSGFPAVYERIPWWATLRFQLAWLAAMVTVFVYAALWRPAADWWRRRRRVLKSEAKPTHSWVAPAGCGLNLLFLATFPVTFFGRMEGGMPEFVYGVPKLSAMLLLIPPVTALLAIGAAIAAAGAWRNQQIPMRARLAHSAVAASLLAFSTFAAYWRLFGNLSW
jgi:CubicO group peptidase (beta-lactamase class C family)